MFSGNGKIFLSLFWGYCLACVGSLTDAVVLELRVLGGVFYCSRSIWLCGRLG